MLTRSNRGSNSRQVKRDEKKKAMNSSPYNDIMQLASMVGNSGMEALLRKESRASASGASQPLPDSLRARFEGESGISLDDVRVHYNSSEPIPFMARAFTKGSDIHIAPGQEDTLEHEATHAVQQKQGRVQPTGMMNGEAVNEDKGLEGEAESDAKTNYSLFDISTDSSGATISSEHPLQFCVFWDSLFSCFGGCCCSEDVDEPVSTVGQPGNRGNGPCAIDALHTLGWENRAYVQGIEYRHTVSSLQEIPADALVSFRRIIDDVNYSFHIMSSERTSDELYLIGSNNLPEFLSEWHFGGGDPLGGSVIRFKIESTSIIPDRYEVRYMTRAEYDQL